MLKKIFISAVLILAVLSFVHINSTTKQATV